MHVIYYSLHLAFCQLLFSDPNSNVFIEFPHFYQKVKGDDKTGLSVICFESLNIFRPYLIEILTPILDILYKCSANILLDHQRPLNR